MVQTPFLHSLLTLSSAIFEVSTAFSAGKTGGSFCLAWQFIFFVSMVLPSRLAIVESP